MLTDLKIRKATPQEKIYRLSDGRGLSLEVKPNGAKLWRYRYLYGGVAKMISLGQYPEVSLSQARELLVDARRVLASGVDPSHSRRMERKSLEITFGDALRAWWEVRKGEYAAQNGAELLHRIERDLLPALGKRPLGKIEPPEILEALRMVERRGAVESAHRLLGWAGMVFRHAIACGHIGSDPTRDLRGALRKPYERHYPTILDPDKIGEYVRAIREYSGSLVVAAALDFGLLTFVRPGNLRAAEWAEMRLDGDNPEWVIPDAKMKISGRKDFVVPLPPQAVAVLRALQPFTGRGRYCFPSPRTGERPLSNAAVNAALRRIGYGQDEMTGHGVRAMARTICHEVLRFAPEVIEEQLAHGKGGALRDAYDRTTHMEERRRLMREWADWLDAQGAKKPAR